ncbi:hypothetical protein [Arthrobacter sp. MMS18-M83]|uniref:hypothetical protein n=1 Tax=Arthrobacter sp. MMS18-M83 TaxID=2996261 RepID=UPI00227AC2C0|nr:hypothetical protein [Arthrobacter sp. MMS18-M83]WAH99764.1 hypothetical protein OW521_23945 [Arthrobacter sp. MMS18-M83]
MNQLEGQGELFAIAPDPLIYTNGEHPTHCVKCREKLTMGYESAGGKGYRWEKCQKCSRTPDPEFRRKLREAVHAASEAAESE